MFSASRKTQSLTVLVVCALIALAVSWQKYSSSSTHSGDEYNWDTNSYNNYLIFQYSFKHLKDNDNLYVAYPEEHFDLYKYSPTFAAAMAPFYYSPDWLGLSMWNLLNMLVLGFGLISFFRTTSWWHIVILLIVIQEATSSIQNSQSNVLMAGMLLFTFSLLESGKKSGAAFSLIGSAFIKLFSLAAAPLSILYKNFSRTVLWSLISVVVLFVIPLLFTSPDMLIEQYKNWWTLLSNDHSASYGYSVMGVLNAMELSISKVLLLGIGVVVFLTPLVRTKLFIHSEFRKLMWASALIWMIIFNHKAESPTFVIAAASLLFISTDDKVNRILVIVVIILSSLPPTGIFGSLLDKDVFRDNSIKAIPYILLWIKVQHDIWTLKPKSNYEVTN